MASPAAAGVDTETTGKAKVKSTLNPSSETEIYRFDAAAGARLTASLKRKSGDLDFALEVRDPTDTPLDLNTASTYSDTGSTISLPRSWSFR